MSVYIRGMEMPTDGNEMIIRIQPDGTVLDQYGHHLAITAIPVPPHGDLIDRDTMIHDIQKAVAPSWYIKERNADMVKFLSLEDTIIPADEVA